MAAGQGPPLPVDAHLGVIQDALARRGAVVVVAEPGAGKTVGVPPALAASLPEGQVLVLEPRRLAARMAARFVARRRGDEVGGWVGHRVRFENVTGPRTRLVYMTEGVLTRRWMEDPTLDGVGVVVFDELHERHLHTDVGLALVQRLRAGARPDLRVVAMSATLDAEPVARFLGAEVVQVPGRTHPVDITHATTVDGRPLERQVAAACHRLLVGQGVDGDVLVFLPGAAEIRRARQACARMTEVAQVDVVALHGTLTPAEQDRAVQPGPRRKIILATNVAETSITVEGVVAVVDSGLARVARHSPWSGLPSLRTEKVSQASAVQRAGRAGRVRPGQCVRLYTRHDLEGRPAHHDPEIRRADLSELVLLLRSLGEAPGAFPFFEPPPEAALEAAEALLHRLGAVGQDGALTGVGRRMRAMPLHPRLARLVVAARERGAGERGALLAALAGERDIRRSGGADLGEGGARRGRGEVGASDLLARLEAFEEAEAAGFDAHRVRALGLDGGAVRAVDRARRQILRGRSPEEWVPPAQEEDALLEATLLAFPDRVGRRRHARSAQVVFAGGGAAEVAPGSVVQEAPFLVAVDVEERKGDALVRVASAIEPEWLLEHFPERVEERRDVRFDPERERVEAVTALAYDGLVLDEARADPREDPEAHRALHRAAVEAGLARFCDAEALERLQRRAAFACAHGLDVHPVDEGAQREVLAEACAGAVSFDEVRDARPLDLLLARMPRDVRARLDRLAPEHVSLPGRRRVPVHYGPDKPPWIASRLQDFFGLSEGPRVADGQVPLVLHLLAPNRRAVQVTTDLAGFWSRHYPTLRKTLMRRYPRHPWPERPT